MKKHLHLQLQLQELLLILGLQMLLYMYALEQNAAAITDTTPLSEKEREGIAAIREALGTNFCRRCNYCAPCTVGINIPSVFLLEGYFSRYDLKGWAEARYSALEKTASDCLGCGICETRCPYNLPIREMLKKASCAFGK